MHAERMILETDQAGNPIHLPKLPPNAQLEANFLVLEPNPPVPSPRRNPHPDLAGKIQIGGDIIDCIPVEHWNLPQ